MCRIKEFYRNYNYTSFLAFHKMLEIGKLSSFKVDNIGKKLRSEAYWTLYI